MPYKVSKRKHVLNITHLLRLPLLNKTSSSQIQETLWRVAKDPVSASVPPLAYRPTQDLKLSIAALSLPTEESKKKAISLLKELGNQEWRKLFFKASAIRSNARISPNMEAEGQSSEVADQFVPRPLVVDLVGLNRTVVRSGPTHIPLENTMVLYTFIKEPSGLLQSLCKSFSQEFMAAGLERMDHYQTRAGEREFGQVKAISTKGLCSGLRNTKPTLKHLNLELNPRFDARDMCEKFKDVVWAKGVHLDRICISELKLKDIVEDGEKVGVRYEDIVSIPLPGVTWDPPPFEYMRIPHGTPKTLGRD